MSEPHSPNLQLPPVNKSILVGLPLKEAFKLFTEGIANWWPLASHSVGGDKTETCVLEGREGGRIYEVQKDGVELDWGKVLVWSPHRRILITWHPGREADTAQEVEFNFKEEGDSTRLDLTHRGWEKLGEKADLSRKSYLHGWDIVLGRYLVGAGQVGVTGMDDTQE